jgi:hypothetical protein
VPPLFPALVAATAAAEEKDAQPLEPQLLPLQIYIQGLPFDPAAAAEELAEYQPADAKPDPAGWPREPGNAALMCGLHRLLHRLKRRRLLRAKAAKQIAEQLDR